MRNILYYRYWPGLLLLCFSILVFTSGVQAHKPSDSYLSLHIDRSRIEGQWDVALRDLDFAIGLDENDDGLITWGELRTRQKAITTYALSRLQLLVNSLPCSARPTEHLVDYHSDGAYTVIRFIADCTREPSILEVDYRLFFDLDPQHRGLLRLEQQGQTRIAIFSPSHARQRFELVTLPWWRQWLDFGIDFGTNGIWHIWTGFDHILFLLALLLPAVLQREAGHWEALRGFRLAFRDVVKIVTTFTLAHSITLSLATLEVIQFPSRWVEAAIVTSIILAALNNVYPLFPVDRRWNIGFAFGLLHGFGFASVLVDLGLPQKTLLLALVSFNLGVEIGQLAIVAVFLPLAYSLRQSWFYQRLTLQLGSGAIALIASLWLVEQLFHLKLLAF